MRLSVLATIVFSCAPIIGFAQPATDELHIGSVKVSGSILERFEGWDWFGSKGENAYAYSGALLQVSFSRQSKTFDWNLTMAVPVMLGLPDRAVQPAPLGQLGLGGNYYSANHNQQFASMIFPKQAFIRFKAGSSSIRIGRFEFTDGSEATPADATLAQVKRDRIGQRLIGTFGFTDIRRSFDGLHYSFTKGAWNLTAVAAVPTRGVFQVDGWGWVKTPIVYASATRQASMGESKAEWRIFGLYYNDDRGVLKTDSRPAPVRAKDLAAINITTVGGHYIQAIPTSAGTLDVLAWGAVQGGKWGSLKQRSGAASGEAGFQPKIAPRVRPWLRGGCFYSSGDSSPNDTTHGTFFAVLPTPRVYARFPFFNEMNDRDLFGELMLRPSKKLTFRSDFHALWLSSNKDLWYTGGGAFQPWTFGFSGRPANGASKLANLYDTSADYQLTKAVALGLYLAYAQGGDVIKKIYPGHGNGMLGFAELNYRF